MGKAQIVITPKAEEDLREIYDYLSEYSVEAALAQIDRFFEKFGLLSDFPRMGQRVGEFNNDQIREVLIGHYRVAYYIVGEDRIDILAVHHSGRS